MALDLGGAKNKKKKCAGEHRIIQLDLFKPTKKKYPVFDFEEIRKEQLGEKDDSGDERFHDSDALELVRRLEAKYGGKSKKKKRRIIGTEDDFIDKCAGYEVDDPFIDDSEAYDELIPSNWDTAEGGFYVNKGKLEFKEKFEMADLSDLSEDEAPAKPTKKRSRPQSDEDMEVEEEEAVAKKKTETELKKPATAAPAPAPVVQTRPSMMGAPPSKKYAPSSNQLAAKAIIKKRLSGVPPALGKPRLIKTNLSTSMTNLSTITNTVVSGQNGTITASETPSTSVVSSPTNAIEAVGSSMLGVSPLKPRKPLPAMSQTLTDMIEKFKKITGNLALPGQKKRLQNQHIDMLISFEDQYIKDGLTVHERARVFHSIADYVGIQRNSLYARVNKRKEDLKGGATPELPPSLPSPTVTAPKPQESSKNDEITVIGATRPNETAPTINGAENLRKDAVHLEEVRKAMDALKKSGLEKESQLLLANYTTYNEFLKNVKKLADAKQQQQEAQAALQKSNGIVVDQAKTKVQQLNSQPTPGNTPVVQLNALKGKFDKLADEVVKEGAKISENVARTLTQLKMAKTMALYSLWPPRLRERFRALFKEFAACYMVCAPGRVDINSLITYADAIVSKAKFGNLITQSWVLLEVYLSDKERFVDILKSETLRDSVKSEGTTIQSLLEIMGQPKKAAPVSSGADDDVQFLDEHGNIPSTSTPKTVGGATSTVTSGAKSTATTVARPTIPNSQAVNAAATLAALQMGLATNNPQNMAALQAMLDPQLMKALQGSSQMQSQMMQMQFLQQAQQAMTVAAKEQEKKKLEEKRLADERKQKEKDEKIRLIQQKKAEALAEKQRQIEEKKRKVEEERRKKAEEKTRREEEERLRRQREQLERERRIQEERERQQRDELERKRREDDERQRQMTLRIKQEEELRRQREEQRLAQLLQEEQLAAALLEDDVGLEAGEDQEAAIRAREEAIEEAERVRRQEEQALAARKSTVSQMEQKPMMHNGSQENHHGTIKMEPQVHDPSPMNQQNGFHQPTVFQQQVQSNGQNYQQPVSQSTVPQSPQYMSGSPYTGPGSNGTIVGQSPLNQQMGQSPYQMNQSPMSHHIPQSPVNTRPPQPQYPQQNNFAGNGFNGMQQQQNQSQFVSQQRMMAQDQMQRQMEHQRVLEQQRQQQEQQRLIEQQRQQELQQRMMEQRQLEQQRLLEQQQRQQILLEEQNAQQQQMLQQQRQQQMLQQQRILMQQQQQQQGQQQQQSQMHQNNGFFPGNQNNFQGYM